MSQQWQHNRDTYNVAVVGDAECLGDVAVEEVGEDVVANTGLQEVSSKALKTRRDSSHGQTTDLAVGGVEDGDVGVRMLDVERAKGGESSTERVARHVHTATLEPHQQRGAQSIREVGELPVCTGKVRQHLVQHRHEVVMETLVDLPCNA